MKCRFSCVLTLMLLIVSCAFGAHASNSNTSINLKKHPNAVQLAKSTRIPYGIWYDPVKWQITKNYNADAEFSFGLKGKDAYAFIINEGVKVPIDVLTNHILGNLTDFANDVSILLVEDRIVNGLPVRYIRADATSSGVEINYLIYLYCGNEEISQIYAYSYGKHFRELEDLLNGFSKAK